MLKNFAFLAVAAIPLPVSAATVVSFSPSNGTVSNVSVDASHTVGTGIWTGSGFQVDWRMEGNYIDEESSPSAFHFMSDCHGGCNAGNGTDLTFSRLDGGTFSLSEIQIGWLSTSWMGQLEFVPFDANGEPDYTNNMFEYFTVDYNNLRFDIQKADGALKTIYASAFGHALSEIQPANNNVPIIGDGVLRFSGDLATELTDMHSLHVSVTGPTSWGELITNTLAAHASSPVVSSLPEHCLAAIIQTRDCYLPGVGYYNSWWSGQVTYNWASALTMNAFVFDSAPAPVPAPASAIALLSCLGSTLLLKRRARKRNS